MELKEKVAYIKGLMEGMKFDTESDQGKLITAIVGVLDDMAAEVSDMGEDMDELCDAVDALSEDLEDVEDTLYGEDDDEDELYEDGLYEITCPNCGEVECVDEDMLADDNMACPNCGTKFEVDFSDDEDDEDGEGADDGAPSAE